MSICSVNIRFMQERFGWKSCCSSSRYSFRWCCIGTICQESRAGWYLASCYRAWYRPSWRASQVYCDAIPKVILLLYRWFQRSFFNRWHKCAWSISAFLLWCDLLVICWFFSIWLPSEFRLQSGARCGCLARSENLQAWRLVRSGGGGGVCSLFCRRYWPKPPPSLQDW